MPYHLLVFTVLFWAAGCRPAKPATIINAEEMVCFTGLQATRSEITSALIKLYEQHPQNRIDLQYMLEAGLVNTNTTDRAKANAAVQDSLERAYFNGLNDHIKPDGSWGERWRLRTSDGKISYSLTLEFCDETNATSCNLCLTGQLRKADLDGTRSGNLQFTKREKRKFITYLETDLLAKLNQIISSERNKHLK